MSLSFRGDVNIARNLTVGRQLNLPQLTTVQRDALTAPEGTQIWNTDNDRIEVYGAAASWEAAGAGLSAKGALTSDLLAGEGIYSLDASAAAFDVTLPTAVSQSRYLFMADDVAVNAVTIKVQAGQTLNGVTDGSYTLNSNSEVVLILGLQDASGYLLQVVGASSSTSLHYASRVASLNSFAGVDTVITFDTDLDDTGSMITDSSVITVQQDGKYSITFDVSGDMTETTAGERFIYVVKNVAAPANDAAAQAAAILTDHTYVDNTFSGAVQWSGGGVFDLVAGDTLVLYFAAASASDVLRVAHFNVKQLPADEVVLAGMVTPTPLALGRLTQTVAQTGMAFGSDVPVTFDTAAVSTLITADTANNKLVVTQAGRYHLTGAVRSDTGTNNATYSAKILVDGVVVTTAGETVSVSSANVRPNPVASITVDLTVGQEITLAYRTQGVSSTRTMDPDGGLGVYLEAAQLPTSTVVDPGLITPTPLYNARYSLTADASGIVCPFDEGQGDTSVITNAGGVITLPAGTYRIEAFATRAGAVLDYDLYDVTHSTVLEHYVVFGTGVDSSGSTMPYYLTVSAATQIQIQETGSSASVVWNGRETNNDADATAQPSYGCYIDIQQLPASTVVDPGSVPVGDTHYMQRGWYAATADSVINFGAGNNGIDWDTVAAAGQRIDLTSPYSASTTQSSDTGLTIATTDATITQNGRYAIAVDLTGGADNPNSTTWVQVVKNGTEVLCVASTHSTASTTQTGGSAHWVGDLIATDVIDFRRGTDVAVNTLMGKLEISITQQAAKTVISTTDLVTSDQATSGYMDFGNMRMQWGTGTTAGSGELTINLPAAFADAAYSVQVTPDSNGTVQGMYHTRTTVAFIARTTDNAAAAFIAPFSWFAVGLKP